MNNNPFSRGFVHSDCSSVGVSSVGFTCVIPGKAYNVKDLVLRAASGQLPPINIYDTYDDDGDLDINKDLDLRDSDNDLSDLKATLDKVSSKEVQQGSQPSAQNPVLNDSNNFAAGVASQSE